MSRVICQWSDLARTGAKEAVIDDAGIPVAVFVVRHGDSVIGYFNSCPHVRLPLNWQDDMFFDITKTYLLCANHGALFDIASGRCVHGPCKGKSLRSLPVARQGDAIVADDSVF